MNGDGYWQFTFSFLLTYVCSLMIELYQACQTPDRCNFPIAIFSLFNKKITN